MTTKSKGKSPGSAPSPLRPQNRGPARSQDRLPDFREFVKENGERLYNFSALMLPHSFSVDSSGGTEEFVLAVLRDFGDDYRKWAKTEHSWEVVEVRCRLFRFAWEKIREVLSKTQSAWTVGRDTRELSNLDEDLLARWLDNAESIAQIEPRVLDRLRWVDPDFRAPLVLRDLVGFEDEEVVRILGIRWGVYRHRLNRGRLDFKESLKGAFPGAETPSVVREAP